MSEGKETPAKGSLTDLPAAPVSEAEGNAVRGGKKSTRSIRADLDSKMKDLEAEDRMGNFEIQG